jgi:hypothetical protein
MKTDREIEKMVAGMGMKREPKRVVVQYAKGMLTGMHMAYVSVARKLLREGSSAAEVKRFLAELTDAEERESILKDAQGLE